MIKPLYCNSVAVQLANEVLINPSMFLRNDKRNYLLLLFECKIYRESTISGQICTEP